VDDGRGGSKLPPLVLMHGLGMSGTVWQDTVPLLAVHHEVFTPTALGHRGGPPVQRRPIRIWDVIDAAEQYLNEHDLQRPHLVGNSIGGFVALELARRGRAATVCALSPVGFWSPGDGLRARAMHRVKRNAAMGRLARPLTPLVMKSAALRRRVMRDVAWHGDRISAAHAVELADDGLGCTIFNEILVSDDERVAPMDPLPCPVTIAWGERDALLPVEMYGRTVRERLPQATFEILPDVAHVPMLDDPELVARTILAATGAANV
jgi:pimeloyl-ACP methyl ester carboxylesterase